jgi:hypothetical protein
MMIPIKNSDKVVIVDSDDYDRLSIYEWSMLDGYAVRKINNNNGLIIRIHREIMGLEDGDILQVDHKNLNRLDNRKDNLRISNKSQNMSNRDKFKRDDITSKFKGVRVIKSKGYYQVRISKDHKTYTIGHFTNEIASANAYNHYAKIIHGEFAKLNDVPFMTVNEFEEYKVEKGSNLKNGIKENISCD